MSNAAFLDYRMLQWNLFIFFLERDSMTPLKTINQLAPDTIQNYRSKLRRLFLSLNTLNDNEAKTVKQKIARLETQLGAKAATIGGPGRPRRR
jgi:ribosomal protein L29